MIKGIPASWGFAYGIVYLKEEQGMDFEVECNLNREAEVKRLLKAVEDSKKQIEKIKITAAAEMGENQAEVFDSHLTLLEDPEFIGAAENDIRENCKSAEFAVKGIMERLIAMLSALEDEYIKERVTDIKDVGNRLIANLTGKTDNDLSSISKNTVVVAHDLTPSDTVQLDKGSVIAFITDIGGVTSHTAIMARTLEIPAVVGLMDITKRVKNGDRVIVDGIEGKVIINPDNETIEEYDKRQKEFEFGKSKLKELVDKKVITEEGKTIEVSANIGSSGQLNKVIENGADGIGLFRTEFLYMDRERMPEEEEQYEVYKRVLKKMKERPVIIRTLDIGGDKSLPYIDMPSEMNPFLGYRAIRLCLDRKDIFKVQLRALLRASVHGNLKIMFPMISTVSEFIEAKETVNECMNEFKEESKSFNESIDIGIMVEVPSVAIMAEEFAKLVDFFSIGTNDLIQYTLAVDRTNEKISHLYHTTDPAVMKLIKMTIDAAHSQGKWCGMCGEMAADEEAIPILLEYGLDEFSVNPVSILRTKEIILENL